MSFFSGSSRQFKESIDWLSEAEQEAIFKELEKTPVYRWRYKGTEKERIGPMTEESPTEIVEQDGLSLDSVSYMGTLLVAVKYLSKRVRALEDNHAS